MRLSKTILVMNAILLAGCLNNNKPDLRETYSYRDPRPFGSKVAYDLLKQVYPSKPVRIVNKNIHVIAESSSANHSLYFIQTQNFYPANMEIFSLMNFVNKGNTVFISASSFDSTFLADIGLAKPVEYSPFQEIIDQYFINTSVYLNKDSSGNKKEFSYYFRPAANYFQNNNHHNFVIGQTRNDQPNLVVTYRGKGALILHCEPRVLSNYFLLHQHNYQYLEEIAGYFPAMPDYIYWDNYYNTATINPNQREGNSLSAILKHPPLKAAFWIVLLTLLLYVLFNAKRRQRIIAVIPPNKNDSVQFAEAIAALYLPEKDNHAIAGKMMQQFHEWVRTKLLLNTNKINPEYINNLSRKTNVPEEEVKAFYILAQKLQNSSTFTSEDLSRLNHQIEKITRI